MSILDETQFIERLQFFAGQRLAAPDLQAIDQFNREMRWLHNASLHQPGIGRGFAISGKKGDRQITIQPGYAIDRLGREIVLTHPLVEPIPPRAGAACGQSIFYQLVVSYPDDADLNVVETRAGICRPAGAVRRQEAPIFCWAELGGDPNGLLTVKNDTLRDDIVAGKRIILAQVEILNCQLDQDVCVVHRSNVRPDCGPRIAGGQAPLDLEQLQGLFSTKGPPPRVDTSAARFAITPCYSAQLVHEGSFQGQGTQILLHSTFYGTPQILNPSPTDFSLELPNEIARRSAAGPGLALSPAFTEKQVAAYLKQDRWHIAWIGIEI